MVKHPIEIALRIPGTWADTEELAQAIPDGYKFTGNSLVMPDGTQVEVFVRPKDNMFVDVFKHSCRKPATSQELHTLRNYRQQVCLVAPGGSIEQAAGIMRAAVAILKAGGAGVFIDNSALSFGATHWCEMADYCNDEALTFGFVNIVHNKQEAYTVGLHVLGQPDLIMPSCSMDGEGSAIIDMILYAVNLGQSVRDGHMVLLANGESFRSQTVFDTKTPERSPMHNPWGRLHLTNELDRGTLQGSLSRRNTFRKKTLRGI